MNDIHCHILPGVDDGPSCMEEAVMMAFMAEQAGISGIVCTPHYIEGRYCLDSSHNLELLESFERLIGERGIRINIYPGNEVLITPDIIDLMEKKEIATINNSRYILIEMPVHCRPIFTDDTIFRLRCKGLVPIVAHPERYTWIMNNSHNLLDLINRGCLTQLNLCSLNGYYGRQVKKTAKRLLEEGLIHLLGSDSHSADDNYKGHSKNMKLLRKIIPADVVDYLIENSKAVVEDREVRRIVNG